MLDEDGVHPNSIMLLSVLPTSVDPRRLRHLARCMLLWSVVALMSSAISSRTCMMCTASVRRSRRWGWYLIGWWARTLCPTTSLSACSVFYTWTSTYACALQRERYFFTRSIGEIIDVSIKTIFIMMGLQSEELRCSHGSCLAHEILIVMGLVGVVATTQLVPFFSLCPPPCLGCGCLLILWQHGYLQGIVAWRNRYITNCSESRFIGIINT